MNRMLERLSLKERRGSKPRCHLLTHGTPAETSTRLGDLIAQWGSVSPSDRWMPAGFKEIKEAELNHAPRLVPADRGLKLAEWWLAERSKRSKTPNFDIASTCTIEGKPGILLIEAKAHDEELRNEDAGKPLKVGAAAASKANHERIGSAIEGARLGLTQATSLEWRISRDSHYQMSNRFAWAWKLTDLGMPVVLVYLGFLNAKEMADKGKPFSTHAAWGTVVREHSASLFPGEVWDRRWTANGQAFVPLIRSLEVPLTRADE